jgi:hypothetical protein
VVIAVGLGDGIGVNLGIVLVGQYGR